MHTALAPQHEERQDIEDDILDEQELQSPQNWEHIAVLSTEDLTQLSLRDEALEDIVNSNSRDVALGTRTDREYRR